MKNKTIYFLIIVFFTFVFVTFFKGLNNSNLYTPNTDIKKIPEFTSKTLIKKNSINSKDIFDQNNFYLFNIWASWCVPCRDEHPFLISLSKNKNIKIIGLNYKDNLNNAEIFLNELGNPYSTILVDTEGTKAIDWGAYGVPETFLIYQNKIIKRYIGPLNSKLVNEIEKYIE